MKPILRSLTFAVLVLAASHALADQRQTKADAPPPPGMDDPASAPATPQAAPAADAAAPTAADDPLAPLPKPDARLVRDKASRDNAATQERIASSDITQRKQGEDTVEEYRQKGHLWMIRIIPIHGPIQTFFTNDGSGRLVRDPREGPVSPVYYSLYEWK